MNDEHLELNAYRPHARRSCESLYGFRRDSRLRLAHVKQACTGLALHWNSGKFLSHGYVGRCPTL